MLGASLKAVEQWRENQRVLLNLDWVRDAVVTSMWCWHGRRQSDPLGFKDVLENIYFPIFHDLALFIWNLVHRDEEEYSVTETERLDNNYFIKRLT